MPGINDDPRQVEQILEIAGEMGATNVSGIHLHLRGAVRDVFMEWLRSYRPDLVERYEELYAHGASAPKAEQERILRLIGHRRRPDAARWGGPQGVQRGDRQGEETPALRNVAIQEALF